ncbi:MAG: VWA domain-containing protein, partial [Pirellulaceae bacterium]
RLSYETGGIYFAVHPNRNVTRAVSKKETESFSAYIKHFFDPQVMRRYRPEYVSAKEYLRRIKASTMRSSMMNTAQQSWVTPMKSPKTRFVKRDEATLANELTEAQKLAAQLEPKINALYEMLKVGESSRSEELSLRWQAGYDLAMGRVLAVKVRTEAYNAMLAQAKRGLKFKVAKNNTWQLTPADEISGVGSQLEKAGDKAREYLGRVVTDHPGTPWALLAQRELNEPIGWKWMEEYTNLAPPRRPGDGGGGNPGPAVNDAKKALQKPPPKRKPPKL